MLEAETEIIGLRPFKTDRFTPRVGQQKRPSFLQSLSPMGALERIVECCASSSQWKHSSINVWAPVRDALLTSACQTYDLLMSAF